MNKLFSTLILALALVAGAFGQVVGGGSVVSGGSVKQVPAGSSPTGGPGSSTDYALAAWNGTGGNLLRNSVLITDANGDLTMPSTATNGLLLYNTASLVDYQRVAQLFESSTFKIRSESGGTLAPTTLAIRMEQLTQGSNAFVSVNRASTSGVLNFSASTISAANNTLASFNTAYTQTSGTNIGLSLGMTYNQASGNAANTDLQIARTETAVGSGNQYFINMLGGVGGATQKAYILSNGSIHTVTGSLFIDSTGGAGINWGATGANGSLTNSFNGYTLNAPFGATATTGLNIMGGTLTGGAGVAQVGESITFTLNQTSTASFTDFLVNRTQTAAGSGTQRLLDLQVSTVSKFNVDNNGSMSSAGTASAAAFAAGNGAGATPSYNFTNGNTTGFYWANPGIGFSVAAASVGTWTATGLNVTGTVTQTGKTTTYNNVATAGMGVGVVVANPRQTAVTNTTATLATYTVPASDSTYRVSANVQVTAATTAAMTVVCTYTDETNTSRAQTIPFVQLAGTFLTSITNVTGTGPYEGATLQIRCKAGTTIVFTTAGTVTGITYNVEGLVIQGS